MKGSRQLAGDAHPAAEKPTKSRKQLRSLAEVYGKELRLCKKEGILAVKKVVFGGKVNGESNRETVEALLFAACQGNAVEAVIHLLCMDGISVDCTDSDGNSLLHITNLFGHTDLKKLLKDRGINTEAVNKYGVTAADFTALQAKKIRLRRVHQRGRGAGPLAAGGRVDDDRRA